MAKSYMGKAPLTLVRTTNGHVEYVYEGQPAPEGIVRDDLKRLLDEGFLVEADVEDPPPPDGQQVELERPAKTANKDVWIDFRVAESDGRLTKEQLSADGFITKDQLQDDAYVAALPAASAS